jgi:Zn-dependent protease with chaperone function
MFANGLVKCGGLNGNSQRYEGFTYPPDSDGGMVGGEIFVEHWKLCFQSGTVRIEIRLDQVVVEFSEDGEQVWFSHREQPDVRFFTFDHSVLDNWSLQRTPAIRAQLRERAQRGDMARRWRLVLYAFLGCIVLAWLGSLALGAATSAVVNRIPLSWDAQEGNAVIEKLEQHLPFATSTNSVAQLTALAGPLMRAIPVHGVQFQFHILEYPEPNAFALPGGHIVVTTGLLKLAGTPEELLGVIAHESAHVTRRHALRHEISGMGPIYMVQILTGGRSRALEALAYPTELLAYESFSQEYEREADSVGWNYLVAAGINPHGMIDMFRKLEAKTVNVKGGRDHPAFDSHPALEKRIAWLEARWEKLPDQTGFVPLTNAVPKISESDLQNSLEKWLQ